MKVNINSDLCQGHTLCNMTAPELFKLRVEDGHAYVEDEHLAAGQEDIAQRAAATCPEMAIEINE